MFFLSSRKYKREKKYCVCGNTQNGRISFVTSLCMLTQREAQVCNVLVLKSY
jgi:hypothetical protein